MTTHSGSNYLLAGLSCAGNVHLILGSNPIAATRCTQSLKAGALPILIAPEPDSLHYSLQAQIDSGSVRWERKPFEDDDLFRLGRHEVRGVVDAVFVTFGDDPDNARAISELCKAHRIPVNVIDAPHLCTFSLLSTHADGPLQIGITTNGRGCKLASRIRREIAASLPPNLGAACAQLGELRRRLQLEDVTTATTITTTAEDGSESSTISNGSGTRTGDLDDSVDQSAQFNTLVTDDDAHTRRIRWLSQICEYWPLKRLASICESDIQQLLQACRDDIAAPRKRPASDAETSAESAEPDPKRRGISDPWRKQGTIILAGSGPGHPQLLTQATLGAIQTADVVLADKLVPSGVMDLIPRRTPVHIARKFPGNADRAQDELQALALAASREGKTVLRLKQGDPFIYGRGGEEVLFFRAEGVPADSIVVLPGITSALSAPLFAGVPATQRDVADQVLLCTGTGRSGKSPEPPEYVPSRTVVFLMALHRVDALVRELTTHAEAELGAACLGTENEEDNTVEMREQDSKQDQHRISTAGEKQDENEGENETRGREEDGNVSGIGIRETIGAKASRRLFPLSTPCAVVERASCPDQRVIRTTLATVAQAIQAEGSRPPGLLIVGRACGILRVREARDKDVQDMDTDTQEQDDAQDKDAQAWTVEDGFRGLDDGVFGGNWRGLLSGEASLQ